MLKQCHNFVSKVRVQGKQKSLANEVYIMNCRRVHIITLVTLTTLAITPATAAKVYKCDGPDGPIYSDRKCGSEAVNVEIQESSGLSGVTEQDISDLAEKKREREKKRELARSKNQQSIVPNQQREIYTVEDPGYWDRDGNRLRNRDNPNILPDRPQPATPPTEPRPVTLPARTPKKRNN
jgi:hypothetical protein